MACQVEGIELCLCPSAVDLTFALKSAKDLELSFATVAGGHVVFQYGIQLERDIGSVQIQCWQVS